VFSRFAILKTACDFITAFLLIQLMLSCAGNCVQMELLSAFSYTALRDRMTDGFAFMVDNMSSDSRGTLT